MSQTEFEAYVMFCAIRSHMTTDYDFFKYQGKVRATKAQYEKRNDKYNFVKLSRLPNNKLRTAASFLEGGAWIGDVVGQQGADALIKHQKYIESCSNSFRTELRLLKTHGSLVDLLYPKDNVVPKAVQLYLQQRISIETLCILDDNFKITKGWAVQYPYDPLVQKLVVTLRNYKGFFSYKPQLIQRILAEDV